MLGAPNEPNGSFGLFEVGLSVTQVRSCASLPGWDFACAFVGQFPVQLNELASPV
jgi:hypothetical protein